MSIPKDILRENPCLSEWSILTGYRGSISHGTYLKPTDPDSIDDKDIMSVCVPPEEFYFGYHQGSGLFPSNGTKEIKKAEWDIVVYEARKFISLLAKGNPNVLSLLWLPENLYVKITEAGILLIANRKLFIGRHIYRSFTGYAYAQLHRMTHYVFNGYMGGKRKSIVDKFGYDTKNASHLIRLLRMGIEFLRDGQLYVMRDDASQLLEIKHGEWTLEQVKAEADRLFKIAESVYLASSLPIGPDLPGINALSVRIVKKALERWPD